MSGVIDTGGPAFPVPAVYDPSREQVFSSAQFTGESGVSVRDYFAAKAPFTLSDAIIAADLESQAPSVGAALARVLHDREKRAAALSMLATLRNEYADAMIKAREL